MASLGTGPRYFGSIRSARLLSRNGPEQEASANRASRSDGSVWLTCSWTLTSRVICLLSAEDVLVTVASKFAMRTALLLRVWFILLFLTLCCASFAADRPPNFVLIFCDDLGYADIGPFGAQG